MRFGRSATPSKRNVPADKQEQFGYGDIWTWAALCADTKLICSWKIGTRGASSAYALMHDLAGRMAHRIQDGHRVYADAVDSAFGSDMDYRTILASLPNLSVLVPRKFSIQNGC
jgi:hypothetical protein